MSRAAPEGLAEKVGRDGFAVVPGVPDERAAPKISIDRRGVTAYSARCPAFGDSSPSF